VNKRAFIKKIKEIAQQDKRRRLDSRYLKVMGFLVAKGFLYTNKKIPLNPNEHINLKEAIWAGRFVEPRILEVLPAAYERFKKHFSGDADTIKKFGQIIDAVKQKNNHKIEYYGITIEKIMPWFFIQLRDKRSKPFDKRKVSKTFRFKPETVAILRSLKEQSGQSETEILEELIATASSV
jgi:antitoxin component of RelBE/YafQ-DinJ toxin-antitoxin module